MIVEHCTILRLFGESLGDSAAGAVGVVNDDVDDDDDEEEKKNSPFHLGRLHCPSPAV